MRAYKGERGEERKREGPPCNATMLQVSDWIWRAASRVPALGEGCCVLGVSNSCRPTRVACPTNVGTRLRYVAGSCSEALVWELDCTGYLRFELLLHDTEGAA